MIGSLSSDTSKMEMLNKQRSKRHPALPGSYLAGNSHFILHSTTGMSLLSLMSLLFIDYVDYKGTTDLKWFSWHWDGNLIKKYNTSSLV